MLEFHDIPFRISRIDDPQNSDTFHLSGSHLSNGRAARRQDCRQAGIHIINKKG
jgi:hypothetical protein